jgi:hypothetical protein
MTTKPKTKTKPGARPKQTLRKSKFEKAAARDFKAWKGDPVLADMDIDEHLMVARMAFAYMHLSKDRLIEGWRKEPELEMAFHGLLKDARECFEGTASLIRTVEARILIAGAWLAEDDKRRGLEK